MKKSFVLTVLIVGFLIASLNVATTTFDSEAVGLAGTLGSAGATTGGLDNNTMRNLADSPASLDAVIRYQPQTLGGGKNV